MTSEGCRLHTPNESSCKGDSRKAEIAGATASNTVRVMREHREAVMVSIEESKNKASNKATNYGENGRQMLPGTDEHTAFKLDGVC